MLVARGKQNYFSQNRSSIIKCNVLQASFIPPPFSASPKFLVHMNSGPQHYSSRTIFLLYCAMFGNIASIGCLMLMSNTWYTLAWRQLKTLIRVTSLGNLGSGVEESTTACLCHLTSSLIICTSRFYLRAHVVLSVHKLKCENGNPQYLRQSADVQRFIIYMYVIYVTSQFIDIFLGDPSFSGSLLFYLILIFFKALLSFFSTSTACKDPAIIFQCHRKKEYFQAILTIILKVQKMTSFSLV